MLVAPCRRSGNLPTPRAAGLLAVGLLAAGLLAAGCRVKVQATIDGADLEQRLIKELAEHDFPATVTCPEDRALRRGDVFTCSATGTDGTPLQITATQEDGDGTLGFQMSVTFIDSSKLIDQIKAKLGGPNTYTCPKRWLLMKQKGDLATCDVRNGAARGTLVITLQDAEGGDVSWEIKPG